MIMKKYKWGILGAGSITHKFVSDLKLLDNAELYAVGSRSKEKAEDYAKQYAIPKAYGSYEELLADKDVEIIYIATPHTLHKEWAIKSLEAGKAVLCEKPITVNASEAEEVINAARKNDVFLMEAMWTRYLPVMRKVMEWISSGAIGEVRMLKADFGFRSGWDTEGRLLNPKYAGGALLDVGIYTLSFAYMVFGKNPVQINALGHIGKTGVDEQGVNILKYDKGELAVLESAVRTTTPQEAYILGTKGSIHLPEFWHAESAKLNIDGCESQVYTDARNAIGYRYEAEEVMRCLSEGKKESSLMTLDESLEIMKAMDAIRAQYGLKYPFEK